MHKSHPGRILTLEEAKAQLEPIQPQLLESFWDAWKWASDWVQKDEMAKMILHSSTMAGIVSDAFGHFCVPRLPRAIWTSNGRFRRAYVNQSLALRFKKLTPDLTSMNVPTEAQRLVYQQDQPVFPGDGARRITQITFGYTLDKLGSSPTGIYFVCPKDFHQNEWAYPVYESGSGQLPLFGGDLPPDESIEDVLNVDIKVSKKRKREHG